MTTLTHFMLRLRAMSLCVGAVLALTAGAAAPAAAALHPRAGGTLFYDDVLDITWMADANAIAGTSYDDGVQPDDGRVSWVNAKAWAATLDYGGYQGWRLPTVAPLNGTNFILTSPGTFNGTKDKGFNISAPGTLYEYSPASELAYMFYINLSNLGYYGLDATSFSDPAQEGWGLTNKGPFSTLEPSTYWTGTAYPKPDWAFRFNFNFGQQLGDNTTQSFNSFRAWAVHDGDVAVVPEPAGLGLVIGGVAGLLLVRRRGRVG